MVESSLIDQAEGLARDLSRLHAERTDVLDTVQQLAHRLRKAGIKLAISGVVGQVGLGMMVWDAFDYAADLSEWNRVRMRIPGLGRELEAVHRRLQHVATRSPGQSAQPGAM